MSQVEMDLAESKRLRDEGMGRVLKPSVVDRLDALLSLLVGEEFTGEGVRIRSGIQGLHPNSWGASINALIRRGRLEKTGQWTQMSTPSSHARMTPLYVVRELGHRSPRQ